MGSRIKSKGTRFVYNQYPQDPYEIQAGNPDDELRIIGSYDVTDNSDNTYTVTCDIDGTILMNGVEHDIVVTEEHPAVSDNMNFTGKPGQDDNQDFGVPFSDGDGEFYIFTHFEVEYQ